MGWLTTKNFRDFRRYSMQRTEASLKKSLNVHGPLSTSKFQEGRLKPSPRSSVSGEFMGAFTPRVVIPLSKEKSSPIPPQKTLQRQDVVLEEDHVKAINSLSTIEDPLWKHVCREVIEMMGPASFLKIWRSNLGPLSSQNKVLDITCETEEAAAFIQQYDFVILGSLQGYFPVLKKLKAEKQ